MNFYLNKTSGTLSDTLLAIGFASCLDDWYYAQYQVAEGTYLYDEGYRYRISIPEDLRVQELQADFLERFQIVLPLDSEKQREKLAKKGLSDLHLDGFPYDIEMNKYLRLVARRENAQTQAYEVSSDEEFDVEIGSGELREEFWHYKTIRDLNIDESFNKLSLAWSTLEPEQKRYFIQLLVDYWIWPEDDIKKNRVDLENDEVEPLQLINPMEGKGANQAKSGRRPSPNKHPKFWLIELLKWRGYMEASVPIFIKENKTASKEKKMAAKKKVASKEKETDKKDKLSLKEYVIQPQRVNISLLKTIMKDFRATLQPTTAIKQDILVSLYFSKVVFKLYYTHFKKEGKLPPWFPKKPSSIATSFSVAFYMYLSKAHATMNLSTIGLPIWLSEPKTPEKVEEAMALLDEHIHIIRDLHNSQGEEGEEEYELLRAYRDFLSGHDLRPFWKFTTLYAGYLISQREKEKNPGRQVRQLTYTGLEQVIMNTQEKNPEAVEILKSEGFQHIADAIRYATVFAQYRRYQHDDRRYEIYYGLEQELIRKARYSKDFTIALARFLARYNDETSLEEEKVARSIARDEGKIRKLTPEDHKKHNLRYITTEDDFKQVVELINKYGSELVGAMLIACGYSFKGNVEKSADS